MTLQRLVVRSVGYNSPMNIYLDIDGVLLANDYASANFADDFLTFVLRHFPDSTYWLTTHCWRGQYRAVEVLRPHLKPATVRLLKNVKPTEWNDLKTDGINFKTPFFWYDDDLFEEEKVILAHYGATACHRPIDLGRDPNQLMDEITYLTYFV